MVSMIGPACETVSGAVLPTDRPTVYIVRARSSRAAAVPDTSCRNKKRDSCFGLGFLFENGCVLRELE